MTNSTCYLYVNTTLRVKTYLHKLVKAYLAISLPQVPYPDWALGLFFWKEMRFILSIKSPVVTPPTTSNWVCYLNGRSWDWNFIHTRLRSRTWSSNTSSSMSVLQLRQHCAPFWWEAVAQFPEFELSRTLGFWCTDPFCILHFLFVGYRLHSLLDLSWVPKGSLKELLIRKGRGAEKEEEQSNGGTDLGQGPGSYSGNMPKTLFESFCRTGPPPRWKMVISDWVQDSCSTALLPHHQPIRRKSHILQPLSQILPSFFGLLLAFLFGSCLFHLQLNPTVSS